MSSITQVLRALGNDQAVANARRSLEERDRETWLLASLTRRLAARDLATTSTVSRTSASAAA